MKAARIETSPRLQRMLALLATGGEHSTLDIIVAAGVCAVSACAAELRANGYDVRCRRVGRGRWLYSLAPESRP
jgi:hypothetical protein